MIKTLEQIKAYTNTLSLIDVHAIITDTNANILYANSAAEVATGYSVKEMIGKNPSDLWGGNMPKAFFEKMWKTIKQDKQKFVGEVKNTKKDGSEYWQEIHITPIMDNKGNLQFFMAIEVPIQDKKEIEAKLDVMWQEFISRENKMAELKEEIKLADR